MFIEVQPHLLHWPFAGQQLANHIILGHLTDSVSHSGVTTTLCTFELPVDNPEGIGYLISGLHLGMNS